MHTHPTNPGVERKLRELGLITLTSGGYRWTTKGLDTLPWTTRSTLITVLLNQPILEEDLYVMEELPWMDGECVRVGLPHATDFKLEICRYSKTTAK